MQYGSMRSVALALTQTAQGPSERQAALSQVGTVCTWSLSQSLGLQKVGIQGRGLNTGGRGKLDVCTL